MRQKFLVISVLLAGILSIGLVGCGANAEKGASPQAGEQTVQTGKDGADATTPTMVPTQDLAKLFEESGGNVSDFDLSGGVSGIGEVKTKQDADLVFTVDGTVEKVLIEEGDSVQKGQILATLDIRTFDQKIIMSEAGLTRAKAQKSALYEEPRKADVLAAEAQMRQAEATIALANAQRAALYEAPREADIYAANAQVRQAEAVLARILEPPEEVDVKAAEASMELAKVNLQAARDQLSYAKTQAAYQVEQAAYQLTQVQWGYALAQRYWEHADEEQTDPVNPVVENPVSGKPGENQISEGAQAGYLTQYEQAKAAMQQAEEGVAQAVVVSEQARKAEVTGVQAAEQQIVQAETALERVLLEPNENDVAQAQAGVDLANANRLRLDPDPTQSQQAQADAGVAQAQATLDLAKANRERINPDPTESQLMNVEAGIIEAETALELARLDREYAELRAPFDGIISNVDISPGDPAMSSRDYAVQVVDMNDMYIQVDISDVDISKVQLKRSAMVYADALPGQMFTGRVSYIAPIAAIHGNIRTYEVRIKLDDLKGLRPGMSVRVEINTKEE
jgi:HlyD family secretion protein